MLQETIGSSWDKMEAKPAFSGSGIAQINRIILSTNMTQDIRAPPQKHSKEDFEQQLRVRHLLCSKS